MSKGGLPPGLFLGTGFQDSVSVFLNQGRARFGAARNFAAGVGALSMVEGDFDGDHSVDLVTANKISNDVSLLLNSGAGTFSTARSFPAGPEPLSLTAGDLDRDGRPDLTVACSGTRSLAVLLNLGHGDFEKALDLEGGLGVKALTSADLDGDGDPDLVLMGPNRDLLGNAPSEDILAVENQARPQSPDLNQDRVPDECEGFPDKPFRRGDVGANGRVEIADAVALLRYLFQRGSAPVCEKAADANDDGKLNITDAVRILLYLFAGQGPLPDPLFRCGRDPTEDRLGCGEFAACGG